MEPLRARRSPAKVAQIVARRPLLFDTGGEPPPWPHVRAASAVVALGDGRLWVVQDDASYLAEVGERVIARRLPSRDGLLHYSEQEGTKALKPDLESAARLDEAHFVLFGSGSTSMRERLVIVPLAEAAPRALELPELYGALRDALGAPLNLDGVVLSEDRVQLLQRGNGVGGIDAVLTIPRAWLMARLSSEAASSPPPVEVQRWDLGTLGEARLSFTDGCEAPQDFGQGEEGEKQPSFMFLASAEDSPDTYDDGRVSGSVLGWAGPDGGWWAPLVEGGEMGGEIAPIKAEGLAPAGQAGRWLVTTDPDHPDRPSELLTVELRLREP